MVDAKASTILIIRIIERLPETLATLATAKKSKSGKSTKSEARWLGNNKKGLDLRLGLNGVIDEDVVDRT